MSMDVMRQLGSNLGTVRAPGIGLLYNELANGIPTIFGQFLATLPAVHSMIIFVCIKYVPVPSVPPTERFLFRRVCPKSYHIFRCIARYGYKDIHRENHQIFEQLLIESLEKFIRREAKERSLESDGDDDSDSGSNSDSESKRVLIDTNGSLYSLGAPLLSKNRNKTKAATVITEASTSRPREPEPETEKDSGSNSNSVQDKSLENELAVLRMAKESGIVYLLGHVSIRARKDSWFIKKLAINYFYAFLRKNCRRGIATLSVPHTRLMEVAITHMV